MRHTVFLILLLLLGGASSAAAAPTPAPEAEFDLEIKGRIEIGPDGRVLDYEIGKATAASVRDLVGKAVRQWQFEPIVENGRPVVGVTDMRLSLSAIPQGEDYLLRINNVWFGGGSPHKMRRPAYPGAMLQKGITAQVVLVVRVDEQGRVDKLHVERTDLGTLGAPAAMAGWRSRFEAAALAAAKHWEFGPIDVIDGKRVAANVRVPVDFNLGGTWGKFYRGDSTPAPWIATSTSAAVAAQDDGSGDAAGGLGSRFRLRSDVVGKAL